MPSRPPSLWTDRRARGDHDWLATPGAPIRPFRVPAEPEPPPKRRPRWLLPLIAVVVALALVGGTAVYDAVFGGEEPVATLPASQGRPAESRINEIYARVNAGV